MHNVEFKPRPWDERRHLVIPGDFQMTLVFCVEHFIGLAQKAIAKKGAFFVALSGGSTPKAIFEHLTTSPYREQIDWARVHLFWSDERAAPPDHPDSNYHMAMSAGLSQMPIPAQQIHRMCAEEKIEENASLYEKAIRSVLKDHPFDLVMLGMGEDGHTASLFPYTEGLHVKDKWVIANFIPQKNCWRMTFTYPCINGAHNIALYVLGAPKKFTLSQVLSGKEDFQQFPSQAVGTKSHPALWIADEAAAMDLYQS